MNEPLSELDIQRCVDGELSEQAQQRLLSKLDQHPDGWRMLALAFVEQQVFTQAARQVVSEPATTISPAQNTRPATPIRSRRWAAMVAAAVIGVGLGWLAPRDWSANGDRPARNTDVAVSTDHAEATSTTDAADVVAPPQPVLNLEFAQTADDESRWTLPVYNSADMGDDYWRATDVLPPEVRRALQESGYNVNHKRQFYSIPLDDGREIAVPVDTVLVSYDGL